MQAFIQWTDKWNCITLLENIALFTNGYFSKFAYN